MKKAQYILRLGLVWLLLMGAVQISFAGKSRIIEPNLSSLTLSANIPQHSFASIHSRRFDHQAINIGWGKRGKKIIQVRIAVGICREDFLSVPILTTNNPVPKDPNYFLLRFSCFSHRGPPAKDSLS
jgi:hypothetical protein